MFHMIHQRDLQNISNKQGYVYNSITRMNIKHFFDVHSRIFMFVYLYQESGHIK